MESLKLLHKLLYNKYGKKTNQLYQRQVISNMILNKNCKIFSLLKDSIIYDYMKEFMKRYYNKKECYIQIPKYSLYYHNYLKFFCKPTFRNFSINKIIQSNGEKLGEIFYYNNYEKKNNKDKNKNNKKHFKLIFSKSVRKNINDISSSTESSDNETIELNKSNFRLLTKNYKEEIFEDESLINILNDLNSSMKTNSKKQRKMQYYTNKLDKKYNKNNKEHIHIFAEEKNKIMNTLNNQVEKKNNVKIKKQNLTLSTTKDNKLNNQVSLKLKSVHNKNLTIQFNPEKLLTQLNIFNKRTQGKSTDLTNNNFKTTLLLKNYNYNKTIKFEPYKTGMIKIKNNNYKLTKPYSRNISSRNSNNYLSSFHTFEYNQKLLNGKYRIKGSCNKSSRNNIILSNQIYSYTQNFSQMNEKKNINFNKGNKNIFQM